MTSKANGVEEWVRAPPPQGSMWSRMTNGIYNPEENSFLGRTPKRWGIVMAFYLVFYAVLALMFALCMGGLYLTLDQNRPTYILDQSLIGVNPGVAARPLYETAVLRYKADNKSEHKHYIDQLKEFFEPYSKDSWYTSKVECNANDSFGYPKNPCVFIKLNRIIGWKPDYYNVSDLPNEMPEDLVEHIQSLEANEQKQIWISCLEENSNDTKLEYPWGRGLPGVFYPFLNDHEYRSPLVAVRVAMPVNDLIVIRCRAWAKNIIYNKSIKEPSGYTRFQLYIEGKDSANATEQKQIWISCLEENSNDTKLEYPWGRGLPGVFYPFLNDHEYRSPLVAVRVAMPVNDLIVIRCRAWAKNIIYNKSIKEPSGYTRFQLYIEGKDSANATEVLK